MPLKKHPYKIIYLLKIGLSQKKEHAIPYQNHFQSDSSTVNFIQF